MPGLKVTFFQFITAFSLFLGSQIFFGALIGLGVISSFGSQNPFLDTSITAIIVYMLLFATFILYLKLQNRNFVKRLLFDRDPSIPLSCGIGKNIKRGAYTLILAIPVLILVKWILAQSFAFEEKEQKVAILLKNMSQYPLIFVSFSTIVAIIVPFLEELVFRGYLQGWLKSRFNSTVAVLVSASCFALVHFEYDLKMDNIPILISICIVGIFLAILREKFANIWAPYSFHAIFNGLSVLMVLFA